jgi:WXG100 family type VII secretion target
VLDDEQVYPIETAADVEDVSGLSAFQVRCLVLAANPEAMYGAAKDYLRTAERLEITAEGIRRGATDLADSWHGSAADASQHQMQQYYASARSLATACRASAAALNHAAAALAATQVQIRFFPGGDFPSLDPTSMQSRCYQKALADLNAGYRDALTLAPTEIAVTLPRGNDGFDPERSAGIEGELGDMRASDMRSPVVESLDSSSGTSGASSSGASSASAAGTSSARLRPRPIMLPPSIPPNSAHGGSVLPNRNISGYHLGSTIMTSAHPVYPEVIKGSTLPGVVQDEVVAPYGSAGSPYTPTSSLAASNADDTGLEVARHAGMRGEIPPRNVRAATPVPGNVPGNAGRSATGSGLSGQNGGFLPYGSGHGEGEQQRERRYYLKEEREVWGVESMPPAILYGEQSPPSLVDYEDDDDF